MFKLKSQKTVSQSDYLEAEWTSVSRDSELLVLLHVLSSSLSDIQDLAEQDTTSGFFLGVLNPVRCLWELERADFPFQSEFDRSIKCRVIFREFIDQFGVKHPHGRIGEQFEHEHQDDLVTSSMKFLKCWYEVAFGVLNPTYSTSAEVKEMLPILAQQLHSLSPSNSCYKSIPLKFCDFLGKLHEYKQTKHNCLAIHELMVSLCQDFKDCEFSLYIEEYFKNKAPEHINLLNAATKEISLYKECDIEAVKNASEFIDSLKHSLHEMNQYRKQGPGFTDEWFQDTKLWKRFCFLKEILAKMQNFASKLSAVHPSNVEFVLLRILTEGGWPSEAMSSFSRQLFNLVCIFFTVIVEVSTNWPNSRNSRDVDRWKVLEERIETHSDHKMSHLLSCAANQASALWLQAEMSGFCYDVCQYSVGNHDQASYTKLNRVENLAVDMPPDCEDIIGMRVWFTDHVSTGGFNQWLETAGSVCGVLIIHVFLRYDRAILRLGKTQAKFYSGSCACGNVQLPSWIEEACVSRLFYQPLLDYLIHDYFEVFGSHPEKPQREPARVVFTGAAFDAVLATVIASELISALVSYREKHQVDSQHTPREWDSLFNHIRSNVFVLSFMLPAVFSRPHFLPTPSSKTSLSRSIIAPHEHLGINMLNITFYQCTCSELVEVWLSIDHNAIVETSNASLWKETSQFDLQVLQLLQKLTSSARKTDHFDSSISESLSKIYAKAKTLLRDQKAKLQTFVADYKYSKLMMLRSSSAKVPFRFSEPSGKKGKSVVGKFEKPFSFPFHCHMYKESWPGMLTFVDHFKLLNCNLKFPHGHFDDGDSLEKTHRKMVVVASFLQFAAVNEVNSAVHPLSSFYQDPEQVKFDMSLNSANEKNQADDHASVESNAATESEFAMATAVDRNPFRPRFMTYTRCRSRVSALMLKRCSRSGTACSSLWPAASWLTAAPKRKPSVGRLDEAAWPKRTLPCPFLAACALKLDLMESRTPCV
jgi:hypothetical protein